jgi:hypothetical protein
MGLEEVNQRQIGSKEKNLSIEKHIRSCFITCPMVFSEGYILD